MKILFFTVFVLFVVTSGFAQNNEKRSRKEIKGEQKSQKTQQIKTAIENKSFVFKAQSVVPMNEMTKTLTSDFGIEVRNDSIYSYMPYYGNIYSRDYSSFKNSPMGFMQPIESYKKVKTKAGYDVNIKVKNSNDVIGLVFHIAKTGEASVVASSINRQSISYMGEILISQPDK